MEIESEYTPNSWQSRFHASSTKHKCLFGGLGSGKTLGAIEELKACLIEYPGSTWIVGRHLLPSLRDSIWKDLMNAIPAELIEGYNKTSLNLTLKNKSEVWGRPCYDPEIFKSYQISGFVIEEANEIPKTIYDRLKDRMRQKIQKGPMAGRFPRFQSMILLNPPDDDHWIVEHFQPNGEGKPALLKDHELFQSTSFDNQANLPPGYIDELLAMYSPEMAQRLVYGKVGKIHKGNPVYGQFKDNAERYIKEIQYDPSLPIIRGWDFGYNRPACVFLQMRNKQVRILGEVLGKKMDLEQFATEVVFPYQKEIFKKDKDANPVFIDFCDPRGADKSDKGKTSIEILNSLFVFPVYKRTTIDEGLRAVRKCLDTVDIESGFPNYLIHPRCKVIIEGNRGGYRREEGLELPEKDGYYEHLQDAKRYAILFLLLRLKVKELNQAQEDAHVYVSPRTGYRREY